MDRYGMWLIYNVQFDGVNRTLHLNVNGLHQTLVVTNYKNAANLESPFREWITEWLPKRYNVFDPMFSDCIFVYTKLPNVHPDPWEFLLEIKLCLKLVYYSPTLISHPFEWIGDSPSTLPGWEGFKSGMVISKKTINNESLSNVIDFYGVLNTRGRNEIQALNEIIQISSINDVIYELMLLWAFIEGYWNELDESKLDKSLINMLTKDFAPSKNKRDPEVNIIRQKILLQNEIIGSKKYSELRNIIAHGVFLSRMENWSKEQWKAIYDQRNLLVETITMSLVNKLR